MRAVSQGTIRRDPYCRLHPELPKRKSRHLKLEDLKTLLTTPVSDIVNQINVTALKVLTIFREGQNKIQ